MRPAPAAGGRGGGRLAVMRRLLAALLVMSVLPACLAGRTEERRVVIGVGSTTEQTVLAAVTAVALARAGFEPELRQNLGGTVGLRREALAGSIDVFWDYTGAAWGLGMGQQAPPSDPEESYQRVRRADEDNGLVWLQPSQANATLALFVRADDLPPQGRPRGLAWLAGELSRGDERLCADADFIRRAGGLEALASAYAMDLGRVTAAAVPSREQRAIERTAEGRCFAALATATSGEARIAGLVPVTDELLVFPAFVVSPIARADRLGELEDLAAALDPIARVLDTEALAALNARAEANQDPRNIAEDFLADALPRGLQ